RDVADPEVGREQGGEEHEFTGEPDHDADAQGVGAPLGLVEAGRCDGVDRVRRDLNGCCQSLMFAGHAPHYGRKRPGMHKVERLCPYTTCGSGCRPGCPKASRGPMARGWLRFVPGAKVAIPRIAVARMAKDMSDDRDTLKVLLFSDDRTV